MDSSVDERTSDDFPHQKGRPIRDLTYDSDSHWLVLTRKAGSVWPRVLPYCIFNMLLTSVIYTLKIRNYLDVTSSADGHKYMGFMMSFLVVTRLKLIYDNYMAAAAYLSASYKACRELVHHACLFTMTDPSPNAKQWRMDVSYATILLLRVTMAVMEYRANPEANPWNVPELSAEVHREVNRWSIFSSDSTATTLTHGNNNNQHDRSRIDEASRAPFVLSYNLRSIIMKPRRAEQRILQPNTFRHPCNEEMKLLDCVGDFLKAFHGLNKIQNTPTPLPFVQMSKTFLFVWLFTLPFVLCHDTYRNVWLLFPTIFLITFGFLGIEFVAMELSDCFGNDPCDLDELGHAQTCFEDIYIAIYKLDGEKWASALRQKVLGRLATQNELMLLRQYGRSFDEDGEWSESTPRHEGDGKPPRQRKSGNMKKMFGWVPRPGKR